MGDETVGKPLATDGIRTALTPEEVRAFSERAPRARISVAVRCVPADTPSRPIEAELVNISASGMRVASGQLLDIGTVVQFGFKLDEGLLALRGRAEVVRHDSQDPVGMGLKFVSLDETAQRMVASLVDAGLAPPEALPESDGDGVPTSPVSFDHGSVRVQLSGATKRYFTKNPLLHIGVGGCFLPAQADIPLGAGFQLDIVDGSGRLVLRCKAKVAAKQEGQVGLRLLDVERTALQTLRGEIAKLPSGS